LNGIGVEFVGEFSASVAESGVLVRVKTAAAAS
jgi:hypothetical protein